MKYTIEQLKDKTDAELNLIAFLAQGWNDHNFDLPNYTPTTNKEQAVDLMIKYEVFPDSYMAGYYYFAKFRSMPMFTKEYLLRAVTMASILSAQTCCLLEMILSTSQIKG